MKNINIEVKAKCAQMNIPAKTLAFEMELSETQFCRKLNHTKINGSIAQFTKCEKFYLSKRLGLDIDNIN